MNTYFVVIWMLFMHVTDDYVLQGILSQLKQKKYWKEHAPEEMYKYDYMMALIMHAISWSFMIMLPIAYAYNFVIDETFLVVFSLNASIHAIVDDEKANKFHINLITDQLIHIAQIALTAMVLLGGL